MSSLSDQIERYLRRQINKYKGRVKIKRNQLAENFDCAPSQINYVLDTRFTVEKGYIVESQRGGGGYVRIIRVKIDSENGTFKKIINKTNGPISQRQALGIIERLFENNLIANKEKEIMGAAMDRRVIGV